KKALQEVLHEIYPEKTRGHINNNSGQLWPFAHEMKPKDWVVVPSKIKAAIHVAEITGPYVYAPNADDPYLHYRDVKWIPRDVPRSIFDQDLLFSFGAFMTICRIERNDAENRVRAIGANGWKGTSPPPPSTEGAGPGEVVADLEQIATDQIAKTIN